MNLLFPLKHALSTPVGDMLIFLGISLLAAMSFYLYFWLRFARQKDLTKCHHAQFKRTEKGLSEIEFKGLSYSDFFGKKQIAALANGHFGQSLIFYPELSSKEVAQSFQDYHMLLQRQSIPYFPKNQIYFENDQLVNIETQFMKANGETLINFAHYSADKTLSDAEKEHFLIDIAYMLEALHKVQTESGEALYHGFLLHSSLYFSINLVKKITNIYLSNYGCAFALGGELFQNWLTNFFEGKYIVDSQVRRDILANAFIFSPEQRSGNYKITSATDFYSFAALSILLFTQRSFESPEDINWKKVPTRWWMFLKQCLSNNPNKRPINFLELKEYFGDPDLEIESSSRDSAEVSTDTEKLDSIKGYFDQIKKNQQSALVFDKLWHEGFTAVREGNYDKALKIFSAMLNENKKSFDAHLGLALLYYQKGEEKEAKEHYLEAKKIDAKRISYFHKLIAFDI